MARSHWLPISPKWLQAGEEVTIKVHGRGGTALGKVKTISGKVEKLVMPGSEGGFLKGKGTLDT